jgi:hypothetical protein
MEGVENLITLTKLELYDNHIQKLTGLENLQSLRILDMYDFFSSLSVDRPPPPPPGLSTLSVT